MRTRVSRDGLRIKRQPQGRFDPGAIFQYKGDCGRLKGFVLIHKVMPKLDSLSKRDNEEVIADDHVVAEVLIPENGYSDYCLFWIEKRFLGVPSPESFASIIQHINNES